MKSAPFGMALCALCALCALAPPVEAAVPDAARKATPPDGSASTTLGAKKLATASECSGAVAFSGLALRGAAGAADAAKPLSFRSSLLDKGVGWKPSEGEFTCYCPGTYQFAFAGDAAAKLVLKKKAVGGSSWSPLVSGPQHVVLMDIELGETVAVFQEGGAVAAADASGTPTLSFSGFRIAKKQ